MSSLSFISLILLLTADTYFGEYLVCTPCAVVDNEVFVLFRSRYFYRDTLFADCIRGKQHEFDVQLLGTCKHNLAERSSVQHGLARSVCVADKDALHHAYHLQHVHVLQEYKCGAVVSSRHVSSGPNISIPAIPAHDFTTGCRNLIPANYRPLRQLIGERSAVVVKNRKN